MTLSYNTVLNYPSEQLLPAHDRRSLGAGGSLGITCPGAAGTQERRGCKAAVSDPVFPRWHRRPGG